MTGLRISEQQTAWSRVLERNRHYLSYSRNYTSFMGTISSFFIRTSSLVAYPVKNSPVNTPAFYLLLKRSRFSRPASREFFSPAP
jgi:hypothetical protein